MLRGFLLCVNGRYTNPVCTQSPWSVWFLLVLDAKKQTSVKGQFWKVFCPFGHLSQFLLPRWYDEQEIEFLWHVKGRAAPSPSSSHSPLSLWWSWQKPTEHQLWRSSSSPPTPHRSNTWGNGRSSRQKLSERMASAFLWIPVICLKQEVWRASVADLLFGTTPCSCCRSLSGGVIYVLGICPISGVMKIEFYQVRRTTHTRACPNDKVNTLRYSLPRSNNRRFSAPESSS